MGELADRIMEAAYNLGAGAARAGMEQSSNPYSSEDPRHKEWMRGWLGIKASG